MTFESAQLIDNIALYYRSISENPERLADLRAEKQLSMRELAEVTGRTKGHIRSQLRKFGIKSAKDRPAHAPYGWDRKGTELVQNAKEQAILCEISHLSKDGKGLKSIAAELNRRGVPSKAGGAWGHSSVRNILSRLRKAQAEMGHGY